MVPPPIRSVFSKLARVAVFLGSGFSSVTLGREEVPIKVSESVPLRRLPRDSSTRAGHDDETLKRPALFGLERPVLLVQSVARPCPGSNKTAQLLNAPRVVFSLRPESFFVFFFTLRASRSCLDRGLRKLGGSGEYGPPGAATGPLLLPLFCFLRLLLRAGDWLTDRPTSFADRRILSDNMS